MLEYFKDYFYDLGFLCRVEKNSIILGTFLGDKWKEYAFPDWLDAIQFARAVSKP